MTYKRFEDLPVWKDAVKLAEMVFGISGSGAFRRFSGFKDQVERAVVSVSNNIAEGFERGTNGELISFLYLAKGSVGEVRSMLCVFERIANLPGSMDERIAPDVEAPRRLSESISRQLCGWLESIKSSGLKGNRSQNQQTRQKNEQARRAGAFLEKMRHVIDEARRTSPILPEPAEPESNE